MNVGVGPVVFSNTEPLSLIAGPCVIESEEHVLRTALAIQEIAGRFVFKASFDKANRSSLTSYRGPGLAEGLRILGKVRQLGIPVLTDIHEPSQAASAAECVDILQIPAFLSRQTDLLIEAGKTGRAVNIKKGQFLSPGEFAHAADKVASTGNDKIILTERGSSFGYNNLVVDMRTLPRLAATGYPVVFDATHSVQLPGAGAGVSGGQPEFIEPLARAAVATGIAGAFNINLPILAQIMRAPGWAAAILQHGMPRFASLRTYVGADPSLNDVIAFARREIQGAFTWDEVRGYRDRWKGTLIVKGILHPQDAETAVALGVDGMIVSNHGGRQVEALPASIDAVPAIARQVGKRATVLMDSGVRSGSDIVRACALGASAAFAGKAFLWGLGALGEDGPGYVVDLLIEETQAALGQLGVHGVEAARTLTIRHPGALQLHL